MLGSYGILDLCRGPGVTALRQYEAKNILEFENSGVPSKRAWAV